MQRPQVPLSTSNRIFYGTDGQATPLMGVNWFGFETSATAVAGLWQVRCLFRHTLHKAWQGDTGQEALHTPASAAVLATPVRQASS